MVQNLLKLDIPLYVAIGTIDENVTVENAYIIPVEIIRHGKKNLTFRHFPKYDHGFIEKMDDSKEIERFDKVTKVFIDWLNTATPTLLLHVFRKYLL